MTDLQLLFASAATGLVAVLAGAFLNHKKNKKTALAHLDTVLAARKKTSQAAIEDFMSSDGIRVRLFQSEESAQLPQAHDFFDMIASGRTPTAAVWTAAWLIATLGFFVLSLFVGTLSLFGRAQV